MKLRRKHWLAGVVISCFLIVSYTTTNSNIAFPVPGNTGDPVGPPPNITCAQCHAGGIHSAAGKTDITFSDQLTTVAIDSLKYRIGQVYTVTFHSKVNAARHGFQLSALAPGNVNGGMLGETTVNKTEFFAGAPPKAINYISHFEADTTNTWTFTWTAPDSIVGDIKFYYAFIAANANDGNDGDTVYTGSTTVHADTTFNTVHKMEAVANLLVYPNPVSDVVNVLFNAAAGEQAGLTLYSLEGKAVKCQTYTAAPFLNVALDVKSIPAGIYLLNVRAGGGQRNIKVVIQ